MKNFKRITKRGLSLFIALMMCMSVMSLTAFAEDEVTTDPVEIVEQVTEPTEETQDPVEVVEPVEDETPAEDPAPVEDEAPAEDPAPAEDEVPAEDPAPAEDEVPAEDPAPVEEEAPVEATIPTITSLTVTIGGVEYGGTDQVVTIPGTTLLSDCTFTLTASEPVTFAVTNNPAEGDFYVSKVENGSVYFNFNLVVYDEQERKDIDLNLEKYSLILTAADGNKWSGSFSEDSVMTVAGLAALLPGGESAIPAGVMNNTSQARTILVNRNAETTTIILCAPGATVYTVTLTEVNGETEHVQYVWKAPAGYTLTLPELSTGFEGWYTDSSCTGSTITSLTVSANQTLYVKPAASTDDFLTQLKAGHDVTIDSTEDWELFAANSAVAEAGQLVTLDKNLDLTGKSYDSLVFKGNFDGGNHTIIGATFREVASAYNSSSESDIYCSGMFASIGAGQIIANLTLKDITASGSRTYAGILAGLVDGSGSNPALIRNIQVDGGNASGRSAAGITGFLRNATVIYCSSKGTTITGVANGGGIVGINNAVVSNCYSTTTPSAFSFMGGTAGGITGKNVRGGRLETCWTTMAKAIGGTDSAGTSTQVFENVNVDEAAADDFIAAGFKAPYWIPGDGDATTFNTSAVTYSFTSNS